MAEIAQCPICGEEPKWIPITGWESGWKTDMLMCCGYGSTAVRGWNKYAAAMELARAMAEVKKIYRMPLILIEGKLNDAVDAENAAKERVLEVFK